MLKPSPRELFRLRSFVRRDSRITHAQKHAYQALWPQFGLNIDEGLLDYAKVFGREAETLLEIGFGSGVSLLQAALTYPEKNFIGVETHKPGVGGLLMAMEAKGVTNLKVYHADVIDVLAKGIAPHSLAGVQIFFPDPWQKRRHHARRLIQLPFISQLITKLKPQGSLHLATDWDDYAKHMHLVLSQATELTTINEGERSPYRPIVSKFEQRALREGRQITDFQFVKKTC